MNDIDKQALQNILEMRMNILQNKCSDSIALFKGNPHNNIELLSQCRTTWIKLLSEMIKDECDLINF